MEAALSIVYNKPALELSTQMVADCANPMTFHGSFQKSNGCNRGDAADAITFMSTYTLVVVGSHFSSKIP